MIPRFLYHGTSASAVDAILSGGLRPRGTKTGNWKHTVDSGRDRVYLTDAYPLYFAFNAMKESEGSAIFEVDTKHPSFSTSFLVPDEDFLEQATRGHDFEKMPKDFKSWDMKRRTRWFRDRPFNYSNAEASLRHLGTISPNGPV